MILLGTSRLHCLKNLSIHQARLQVLHQK
uniref:Uncharacterized protein n=1 Tax=Arundo donax TaxID=35708 RepID=A0A0A8YGP7_ARUDO